MSFVVAVTVWSVALAGITYPTYGWAMPSSDGDLFSGDLAVAANIVYFVVGLVVLVAAPYVRRGLAAVDRRSSAGSWARAERCSCNNGWRSSPRAGTPLSTRPRRSAAASSATCTTAPSSGSWPWPWTWAWRATARAGRGPGRHAELIGQAHDEAKRAITELRELVRGIHPAVLADRGLDAALSSVAARCPVPVQLSVDLPERPPAPVEAAAYFVVAEALTNVAKHSYARQVWVRVPSAGPVVVVEITDDGVGGAPCTSPAGWRGWPTA